MKLVGRNMGGHIVPGPLCCFRVTSTNNTTQIKNQCFIWTKWCCHHRTPAETLLSHCTTSRFLLFFKFCFSILKYVPSSIQSFYFPGSCLDADQGSVRGHLAVPTDCGVWFQYLRQLPGGFLVDLKTTSSLQLAWWLPGQCPSFLPAAKVNIMGMGSLIPLRKR